MKLNIKGRGPWGSRTWTHENVWEL